LRSQAAFLQPFWDGTAMSIMGFSGLAVDGGNIFMQKRLAQNGADAAALVGTRDIAKSSFGSVSADVTTYARTTKGQSST
jgi:Flp pilus assembly protein TadG